MAASAQTHSACSVGSIRTSLMLETCQHTQSLDNTGASSKQHTTAKPISTILKGRRVTSCPAALCVRLNGIYFGTAQQ